MKHPWEEVALGQVCSVLPGFAFKSSDWSDKGTTVIRIGDICADRTVNVANATRVSVTYPLTSQLGRFALRDGDIVLAMTGATAGKVGRLKTEEPALLNQRVAKLTPVSIDLEYFWALISSPDYERRLFRLADGAAQPNMSGSQIEQVMLPTPPIMVQQRIGAILSAYDDLIEVNRRRVAILEEMARRLFEEWFVHLRFPGHDTVPVHDTPYGPLPDGWVFGTLGDLAATRNVTISPGDNPEEMLCHYSFPAFDRTGLPEIERAETILSNKTLLAPPVLLIGKLNPKKPKIWPVFAPTEYRQVASTEFVPLAPQGRAGLAVLTGYASSSAFLARLRSFASGTSTSHQRVRPDDILAAAIAIPPPELLSSAEQYLDPLQRSIGSFRQINDRLTVARDLLLPRLVSGELSVADAPAPAHLLEAAD